MKTERYATLRVYSHANGSVYIYLSELEIRVSNLTPLHFIHHNPFIYNFYSRLDFL